MLVCKSSTKPSLGPWITGDVGGSDGTRVGKENRSTERICLEKFENKINFPFKMLSSASFSLISSTCAV